MVRATGEDTDDDTRSVVAVGDATRTVTLFVESIGHVAPDAGFTDRDSQAAGLQMVFGIAPALDGIDGIPGTRGLSGYAESLSRATKASSLAALNATRWFLDDSEWQGTGNRSFSIRVSASEEALLERIGVGALLTLYADGDNWADYVLASAVSFTGTGASRTAALTLTYREGVGAPPASGGLELHFTPGGPPGIDGRPGRGGLSKIVPVNLGTAVPDDNTEARVYDGTNFHTSLADLDAAKSVVRIELGIGLRTGGTAAGAAARQKAYDGIKVGDTVAIRDGAPVTAWSDYEVTAKSPATVDDTTRTVTLTVVWLEGEFSAATANPVVFGMSGATDGEDGPPGIDGAPGRGGVSRILPVNLGTAVPDDNTEARLSGGTNFYATLDDLDDARAVTSIELGIGLRTGGTAAGAATRQKAYSGIKVGDTVTIRDGAPVTGWADYEVTAIAPTAITAVTRTVTLTVRFLEGRIATATSNPVVFGMSGAIDGEDAAFFRRPATEVFVSAQGESVSEATVFSPDPATVEDELVHGDEVSAITVSIDVTPDGATLTLQGPNASDFEIVE